MTPIEKAREGLRLMKTAILETISENPNGLTNAEVASRLDIHSHYLGKQKDYLSWSIIGLLLNEGKISKAGKKYKKSAE